MVTLAMKLSLHLNVELYQNASNQNALNFSPLSFQHLQLFLVLLPMVSYVKQVMHHLGQWANIAFMDLIMSIRVRLDTQLM